jgi:hypothetical protein
MSKRYHWLHQSQYLSPLSPACKMCAKGAKLVVLITGLCPAHCFYCPLSKRKHNKDVIYADEWKVTNENNIDIMITEAELIKAEGAGITGGDPLLVPSRTITYIKTLKQHFGKQFHIHLYTSGLTNTNSITKIVQAGLDEIRFHPEPQQWKQMHQSPLKKVIAETEKLDVDVAIEIPVIPGKNEDIINLITWADSTRIKYINLNELEFSERNENALYRQGMIIKNELSAAALGSQETAYQILNYFEDKSVTIGIHYCSASFKDGIQLTNRMKRRATSIASNHDVITEEGTLLKGIIEPTRKQQLSQLILLLSTKLKMRSEEFTVNKEKNRLELHPEFIEKHASTFISHNIHSFIIEEYPTADHLEVERIPIT